MEKEMGDRRRFLQFGAMSAGALVFSTPLTRAFAASCGFTPQQTPGPFYPGESKFQPEFDLTRIPGHTERAQGQIIYVRGRILDSGCKPIAGANVEIWQACASGKYSNSKDPNPAEIDPNFRYWSEATTDETGEYTFKTIIPGAYPADSDWTRPPHIHFKVSCLGYRELVTQMYFRGHPLNDRDLILQAIPEGERSSVIVDFEPSPVGFESGSLTGNFDITIRSVRERI